MTAEFSVGDTVVLPTAGPVEIVGTVDHDGTERFVLEATHRSYYVPIEHAGGALRPVVAPGRARELLEDVVRAAHPDDRPMRERADDGTYAIQEGSLADQLAVLGSMYASGLDSFGERKLAGQLEEQALDEVALALDRDREALAEDLRQELAEVDRPPKSPDLTPRPEAEVESVPDDGPDLSGYDYLGTFRWGGELVVGDPTYVTDEELSELVVAPRAFSSRLGGVERTPRRELRVETGRLCFVDAAVRRQEGVAFELRQYLRSPEAYDWGAGSPTEFGDGYFKFATQTDGDEVVLADIDLW